MKITPYLLYLNGFDNHGGRNNCWRRVETGKLSDHKIEMQVEPAAIQGLWLVRYRSTGVRCPVSCDCYLKTFQDLMALSEVFARNREGYTDVEPIEVYIPNMYSLDDWERGEYDQFGFNEYKYSYE